MSGNEQLFVNEAFQSNWISPAGPHISSFETELADYLQADAVAALSSGTAAIHLALILLGVKPGDEVICSTFTFAGSCNPIIYQGAVPVFVDSEKDTWNMDPELLEKAVIERSAKGKKPKAIILVHLYGMPAKVDEIMKVAQRFEIPVIEDAAEALGSLYRQRKCGNLGDFSILSFNGNKIITTSGGGALVSANKGWIERAKFLATQARDIAPHYQHSQIGYNYRLSNICAGIGRGQLQVIDLRVKQRRAIFDLYSKMLPSEEIEFQPELPENHSNRWLTCLTFQGQRQGVSDEVRLALEKQNIESRPLWKPMHLQPVFQGAPSFVNGVSEQLFNKGLCLPSGSAMSENEVERVCKVIRSML